MPLCRPFNIKVQNSLFILMRLLYLIYAKKHGYVFNDNAIIILMLV
jgi:hypothetical protein